MSQREAEGRACLLGFAAQLITITRDDTGSLAERMSRVLLWMLARSPSDREAYAQDLVDAARASLSTGQPHLAIAELTSWKETATAVAAGLGNADLEWLDEDETVERPWPWQPPTTAGSTSRDRTHLVLGPRAHGLPGAGSLEPSERDEADSRAGRCAEFVKVTVTRAG